MLYLIQSEQFKVQYSPHYYGKYVSKLLHIFMEKKSVALYITDQFTICTSRLNCNYYFLLQLSITHVISIYDVFVCIPKIYPNMAYFGCEPAGQLSEGNYQMIIVSPIANLKYIYP